MAKYDTGSGDAGNGRFDGLGVSEDETISSLVEEVNQGLPNPPFDPGSGFEQVKTGPLGMDNRPGHCIGADEAMEAVADVAGDVFDLGRARSDETPFFLVPSEVEEDSGKSPAVVFDVGDEGQTATVQRRDYIDPESEDLQQVYEHPPERRGSEKQAENGM